MTNKIQPRQINSFFLRKKQNLLDLTIPIGQNYVVLSVSGGYAPTEEVSFDDSIEGIPAAILPGTTGSHSLLTTTGITNLTPKNLIKIRKSTNLNPILSNNKEILGLLQCSSGMVSGDIFDDISKKAQISFIREDSTGNSYEAVPIADIEGQSINYQYMLRLSMASLQDDDYIEPKFQEPFQGGTSTTGTASFSRIYLMMGG